MSLLRRKPTKPDLHYQARLEREIYGRVVSESLRNLPRPNPYLPDAAKARRHQLPLPPPPRPDEHLIGLIEKPR